MKWAFPLSLTIVFWSLVGVLRYIHERDQRQTNSRPAALPLVQLQVALKQVAICVPAHNEALVIKHGGHADQLSKRYWGMDRFRIQSLQKILEKGVLDYGDRTAAIRMLCHKIDVFVQGAEKRGNCGQLEHYRALRQRYAMVNQ